MQQQQGHSAAAHCSFVNKVDAETVDTRLVVVQRVERPLLPVPIKLGRPETQKVTQITQIGPLRPRRTRSINSLPRQHYPIPQIVNLLRTEIDTTRP